MESKGDFKNILILYESFFGNTMEIAREIGKGTGKGNSITVQSIDNVDPVKLQEADLLIVGSATRGFSPSPATRQFLKNLGSGSLNKKLVASFDTRISLDTIEKKLLRIMVEKGGYAAKPIGKILEKKGGCQITEPEGFLVEGERGPLVDGELERAREWGVNIARLL